MAVPLNGCLVLFVLIGVTMVGFARGEDFYHDFEPLFGDHKVKISGGGQQLSLALDKASGSRFKSKKAYLFGRIDMQLKLVAGDSAGTVTAYYAQTGMRLTMNSWEMLADNLTHSIPMCLPKPLNGSKGKKWRSHVYQELIRCYFHLLRL